MFTILHTVFLRMLSGYNSETLSNPGPARQYAMYFGNNAKFLMNPGSVRQYAMAPRPGFGGFDRVSELYPEDILRPTVEY